MSIRSFLAPCLVVAALIVGCGSEAESESDVDDVEVTSPGASEESGATDETTPRGVAGPSSTRSDVDCDSEALGDGEGVRFSVAHYVVDGALGAVCFGEPDETLTSAWTLLAQITPPGQLADLALFGGFGSDETGDSETLAFVNVIDNDGENFQMSVNLEAFDADPSEAALTMAHEFTHVFTAIEGQLDRVSDPEDCETFDNSEGCYLAGSILAEWVELFWEDDVIDELWGAEEADEEAGAVRCESDGRFLSPYAATNPEEDFAETFAAYVFRIESDSDEVNEKLNWIASQPGLAEFRELADDDGIGPLDNNFEGCGL